MKTNKILLALFAIFLSFSACKNSNKSNQIEGKNNDTIDMHDSKTSVDWQGSYFGVLPCASCPGINTMITLNSDNTYEKTVEYLESDDNPETTKGKFTWDDKGSIINIGESSYLIGENMLFSLDSNKKVIEGELADNYILTKIELQAGLDANEGYTLQSFIGSDNKKYNIVFNTNPKTPIAVVETEGLKKILSQTTAWAKGAEYAGNKIKLKVQGSNATLIIEGKEISLKESK